MKKTVIRLLDEAQKETQALRAENHSFRIQLHRLAELNQKYQDEHKQFIALIRLLEGGVPNAA